MSNIPILRFKEFSKDWEEKKLNEVASINPKSNDLPNRFIYIDLESVEKGSLVKSNEIILDEAPSRAQRLLSVNDILFQTVRPYQKNNYFFKLYGDYVASTGYAQIKANESPEFLYQIVHTDKFVHNVMTRCTGTSYPSINSTDLSKIKIKLPQKQEQEKIASFLTSVDTKIEQLNDKIELLKEYKKGIIQKIFSQDIRFKDDDGSEFDDWNVEKLDTMLDYIVDNRGKTPPILDNGIPLIEINAIGNKHIDYSKLTKFVNDTTFNDWFRKYLKNGDILFSTVGQTAMCSLYSDDIKAAIAQNIVGLRFNKECDSSFMYYLLTEKHNNHQFKRIEMGAVQPSVKISQMIHLKFSIPELKEQIKIANFLSSIDKKIGLVQEQLKQTKEFKKALLQQMFI